MVPIHSMRTVPFELTQIVTAKLAPSASTERTAHYCGPDRLIHHRVHAELRNNPAGTALRACLADWDFCLAEHCGALGSIGTQQSRVTPFHLEFS
jgi:hypothetical protein